MFNKSVKSHLLALASYLGITILFTWPLVLHFTTHMPGIGAGDGQIFYWNLWWFKKALLELKTNPLFCNWILYPFGTSTVFCPLTVFNDIFSLLFQQFFGLVTTYNIILVFDFVASAYGMFLLADYLTGDKKAAFIAGIIFAFCPYKFAHLPGHFSLISTEWIPFYVLYLIKALRKRFSFKNSLLAGVFLLLVAFSDYYYLNFVILFTIFYVLYSWFKDKSSVFNRDFMTSGFVIFLVLAAGLCPLVLSAYKDFIYGSYVFGGINAYSEFVSDIAGFFTPSIYHPLFKKYVINLNSYIFTGGQGESLVFIGYTVIFLVVYGLAKFRVYFRQYRFWVYCAAVFFILSLGPFPHIFGRQYRLYLPGYILTFIPGFSGMRCFSRLVIMGMLCLSAVAAMGCGMIFRTNKKRNYIFIIITLLLLFEYLPAPYPVYKYYVPEIYGDIARDQEDCSVLEVPMQWYITGSNITQPSALSYHLFQTVHNKRIISAFIARGAAAQPDSYLEMPFLNKLYALQENISFEHFYKEPGKNEILDAVKFLKLKYIVIHKKDINLKTKHYIEEQMPLKKEKIYDDTDIEAFKLTGPAQGAVSREFLEKIVVYGQGWYDREPWGDKLIMHWSRGCKSLLSVFIQQPGAKQLRFKAIPFPFGTRKQTVKIFINKRFLHEQDLAETWSDYSISAPASFWEPGENSIEFRYKIVKSPKNMRMSADERRLAVALSNFEVLDK